MFIRFPEVVPAPSDKEVGFLKDLNERLGNYGQFSMRANMSGHEWDQRVREYNSGEKIDDGDMQKILGLLGLEKRVVLIPHWAGWEHFPLFSLGHVGAVPDLKDGGAKYTEFLDFKENQVSREYKLGKLWEEPIHSEENLQLMDEAGIKRPEEFEVYCY